ncbi:hypothetical protein TNCV_3959091 [Trichonephila clavipes]|nr:hypothetical protein TNCV_3959091 [Trichonephila clavipes]
MGKLPDLHEFDRGQIVGARRMGHSNSEIVRQLGSNGSCMPGNIWQVIPVERFQKLVESLPRHVAAVIKARGDSTCY